MFYITESDIQIEALLEYSEVRSYIEIISTNDLYHPKLVETVAVYIRPISAEQGYILPVTHDEGLNLDKSRVYQILKQFNKLYTVDKKQLLYHFNLQAATDVSLLASMKYYKKLEPAIKTNTYNWYYGKYAELPQLNRIVPLTKLYENCENSFKAVQKYIEDESELPSGFDFYNTTATNVFYLIEQTGIGINEKVFLELFKTKVKEFNITDNVVYSYYNLYNTTSRPSNAFNSINFAAIPKEHGYRESFEPQNDYFVELDFDGYHIRLLCEQIGYELNENSAHGQLAKLYYKKDNISDEDYAKAKQVNFQAIYGRIPEEYRNLEIFKLIQQYIDQMWAEFQKNGKILAPISEKPFTSALEDMNPQKLMNYVMQSMETSRNIKVLKELLGYLQNKHSKIALYVYDAIILDFSKEDGKETLEEVQRIMEAGGKYPVKFKYAKNLVL